jgi:hypothetical protein
MSCFEDYMQFRDEVNAAKMRMNEKETTKKTAAGKIGQRAVERLPGTDSKAEELQTI